MNWEYSCELFHPRGEDEDVTNLEEMLNDMGQKGWRYVSYDPVNSIYTFERPVQEEKEQPAENV